MRNFGSAGYSCHRTRITGLAVVDQARRLPHRSGRNIRKALASIDLTDSALVQVVVSRDPVLIVATDKPGFNHRHLLPCQIINTTHTISFPGACLKTCPGVPSRLSLEYHHKSASVLPKPCRLGCATIFPACCEQRGRLTGGPA